MAQEKFSGLDAVVTPALTDITAVVQAAEVNVKNRKTTWQQVFNLFRSAGQSISDPDYVVNLTQDNQTLFYENSSAANWTLPLLTIGDVNKILYIKNSSVHQLALASVSPVDNSSGASLASFEARIFKIFFTEGAFRYQTIASFVTELPVSSGGTGAQSAAAALINLGAEASANKNAANGYAGLDASKRVKVGNPLNANSTFLSSEDVSFDRYVEMPDADGTIDVNSFAMLPGNATLDNTLAWFTLACTSATAQTITLINDGTDTYPELGKTTFIQQGAGQYSFSISGASVNLIVFPYGTLTSASGVTVKTAGPGARVVIEKLSANLYVLSGELTT